MIYIYTYIYNSSCVQLKPASVCPVHIELKTKNVIEKINVFKMYPQHK